jgi:hypothetical protein
MAEDNNIWIAASDGHLSEVVAYVDGGVSVDAQDEAGYFPLCVPTYPQLLMHASTIF